MGHGLANDGVAASRRFLGGALGIAALLGVLVSGCSKDDEPVEMADDVEDSTESTEPTKGPDAGRVAAADAARGSSESRELDAGLKSPTKPSMDAATSSSHEDAGQALDGASVEASPATPDCMPSGWKDPGKVPNPKISAVAADAGTKGQLFGKSKGIEAFEYLEEEFFLTGTSPAYISRIVVHRHKDASRFSGTVFMEWYNVTGGIDIAPLWATSREYFMREGHVHVGVSAQAAGANALKSSDAERYRAINHPGDTAANAIFAQAAMALRSQGELLLGPCMPVDAVIGVGQSQSASMLGAYLDSAHAKDQIYDGFMLHSSPFGAPTGSEQENPVFVVSTMNEGDGELIQGPKVVEWEVAGASHNDAHLTARGKEEQGGDLEVGIECAEPLNNFPSYWVYNAALDWLNRWVRKGEKPPPGAPLQTAARGALELDQYGNVRGGVRIQDLEVPIASYTSSNSAASVLDILSALGCGLGGSVVPLTEQQLLALYPTHDDYVQKYTQAADKAVADGYLLPADREIAIMRAQSAPIPR